MDEQHTGDNPYSPGNVVFIGKGKVQATEPSAMLLPINLPASSQRMVARMREVVAEVLQPALGDMLDAVDDDLYRLAENSTSNAAQTTFFDAMRSLRVLRQRLEKSYLGALHDAYDRFWHTGGQALPMPKAEQQAGELSLVADEELEEELATTGMITKASNRLHSHLFALNKRFSSILGGAQVDDGSNPLAPMVIVRLFQHEMSAWEGDIRVRIVVYKLFDKHVLSSLKTVYETLNQHLVDAGVLPEIHGQAGHAPAAHHAAMPAATGVDAAKETQGLPAKSLESQVPSLPELWSFMQQMMAFQQTELGLFRTSLAETAHLPELPHEHVFAELDQLQRQAPVPNAVSQDDLKLAQEELRNLLANRLGRMREGVQTQRLSLSDQQAIDVILLLFNEMLDDPELPDAMRAMLARLQIPVLKAAIADPTFIHNQKHPARLLLNNLAKASLGWSEDSDRSDDSLYGRIKAAVERVLHEFNDDVSLFAVVNQEFLAFQAESAKRAAAMERRTAQVVEGEDKLDASRKQVDELYQRLDIGKLPAVVQEILNDPWRKLLTIVLLRQGEESAEWKEFVAAAEELVESVLPGEKGMARSVLLASIPRLGNKLRKGLGHISFNQNETRRLLNELQAAHISVVRSKAANGSVPVEPSPTQAVAVPAVVAKEPPPAPTNLHPVEDEYVKAVSAITEGQWVRMVRDSKEVTGKLVWRSKFTGTMLFVDGQGRKVAQIKESELVALFRDDLGSVLQQAETPLIDRALGRVLKFMKNSVLSGKPPAAA